MASWFSCPTHRAVIAIDTVKYCTSVRAIHLANLRNWPVWLIKRNGKFRSYYKWRKYRQWWEASRHSPRPLPIGRGPPSQTPHPWRLRRLVTRAFGAQPGPQTKVLDPPVRPHGVPFLYHALGSGVCVRLLILLETSALYKSYLLTYLLTSARRLLTSPLVVNYTVRQT